MALKVFFANILFMLRRSLGLFASRSHAALNDNCSQLPENSAALESLIHADLGASLEVVPDPGNGSSLALSPVREQSRSPSLNANSAASDFSSEAAPRHVAIIMDGNNRWAKRHPMAGMSGHKAGVETIRSVLDGCERHGVEVLTLFAFSSENWARPQREVNELMGLFKEYLNSEVKELHKKGVRLRFIGRRDRLDTSLQDLMSWAEQLTYSNVGQVLVLAVDYGGRWDICQAVDSLVSEAVAKGYRHLESFHISEEEITAALQNADLPEPDLCIRTGGEYRVSNFMLWQFSYAEFYFTEKLWPDFGEDDFSSAIDAYANRERRFGCTSEQVASIRSSSSNRA